MLSIAKGRHVGSAGPYAVDAFPPTVADAATARDAGILALSVQLASLIAGAARRWRHSGAGQMIDGHRLHNAAALRTPLRQPLLGPRGADNPPDCVRPSPGDL